jgi:hypothetical protein
MAPSPLSAPLGVAVLALTFLGMAVPASMPFQMIVASTIVHPLGMVMLALVLMPFGDANLGEGVGFDVRLHDCGFDYSPTRHERGGYGFEERRSWFDGNFGGGFGFDGRVPNGGINYLPTWHGHGGSGFAAPWRGDSGLDVNFGGGPGFDGLDDDQRIQYSTYWRGGGGFDSPRLDPCSCRAGPFPFLTAAGVPHLPLGPHPTGCRRGSLHSLLAPYPTGWRC